MNGGLNQINGLSEPPFDRLRANGLIQSLPSFVIASPKGVAINC